MSRENIFLIEGEKFTIDYSSKKIYRGVAPIPNETLENLLMTDKESYPFKENGNKLYFQIGNKFYKVLNNNNNKVAFEISKKEYDTMAIIVSKPKGPLAAKYVIAIIIEEIMQEKYNKKISNSLEMVGQIAGVLHSLNPQIKLQVDSLARMVTSELPEELIRSEVKKNIKEIYDKIAQEDEEKIRLLLDDFYEINKDNFDALYNSLLEKKHPSKKGNNSKEEHEKIKREKHQVKLTLPARGARPAPPVTTILGPSGINIHKFCADFNEWSKDLEGNVEFGVIIYDDLSYDILTKDEMNRREMAETAALFKRQYDPTYALRGTTSSLINNEQQNPISIIREKLEELYSLYGGNPTGGEIIAIEELDCAIGKGRDLHFNQNELSYYAEEGFIHIKGTKDNFSSRSHIQLTGKNIVVLADIKEGSKEFEYLSNVIKKIDSILQDNKKKR